MLSTITDKVKIVLLRSNRLKPTPVTVKWNFCFATLILLLFNTIIQVAISTSHLPDITSHYSYGALILPYSLSQGEWFRFLTACFVHQDWSHYTANILFFISFPIVENRIGTWRFLLLYLLSGFVSNAIFLPLLHFHVIDLPAILLQGASGAIYGVIAAMVGLLLKDWQERTLGMTQVIIVLIALYATKTLLQDAIVSPISFWGHLMGCLTGFITFSIIQILDKQFESPRKHLAFISLCVAVTLLLGVLETTFGPKTNENFAVTAKAAGLLYEALGEQKLASDWFLVSAKHEDPDAQAEVARRYSIGLGLPQSVSESFNWASKAANHNNVWAQKLLAEYFWNGEGIQPNRAKALHWMKEAAENNDIGALKSITEMYFLIRKDSLSNMTLAYFWSLQFLENPESKTGANSPLREKVLSMKETLERELPPNTANQVRSVSNRYVTSH